MKHFKAAEQQQHPHLPFPSQRGPWGAPPGPALPLRPCISPLCCRAATEAPTARRPSRKTGGSGLLFDCICHGTEAEAASIGPGRIQPPPPPPGLVFTSSRGRPAAMSPRIRATRHPSAPSRHRPVAEPPRHRCGGAGRRKGTGSGRMAADGAQAAAPILRRHHRERPRAGGRASFIGRERGR